ncbi:class I SAM-dependent methyltransferase [Actinomadura livida]|uniref:SAM-dependent methyltransferase n=1 Tax=Actinomadura livida TaxID=79909 RepID=A0A7W7I9A4_9ACTN|nr:MULTISPECIES: class I SAM-dependent methyltransferase [Actinomadura]MBB4772892.1 SAM-dependent methyltransferase [Actinomadura catellatispora]GGU13471.1 methyltransferase [Actinomadura livida]
MGSGTPEIVNVAQYEAWNGYEGRHWADHHDRYDAGNGAFNGYLLEGAAIGPRDRVLDIGCGSGQVTRLAAGQARLGSATGVDLSAPMLARARSLAGEEGVANVTFEQGDAQVYPFATGAFDVAVSRFGVMFFADPVAAFGNIRRALRGGGRLAFLSMAPIAENDIGKVLAALPPLGHAPVGHDGGPLSLSEPDRVREVLEEAGFRSVACRKVHAEQVEGRDARDAGEFFAGWGPIRYNYGESPELVDIITEAMRPFERDGAVRLRGAAWLVTARA